MVKSTCFCFDLDGTITTQEILPLIAGELGLQDEISILTKLTLNGHIPFEASLRLRCAVLRAAPLDVVRKIVSEVGINPDISAFISEHRKRCYIITGNLDVWIEPLVEQLGCQAFTSKSIVQNCQLTGVGHILRKNEPVMKLRERYERVVVVGESVNDLPMFESADIGIAFGGVHAPAHEILAVADYIAYDGASLCRLLRTLL